jgi:hypothetical protein
LTFYLKINFVRVVKRGLFWKSDMKVAEGNFDKRAKRSFASEINSIDILKIQSMSILSGDKLSPRSVITKFSGLDGRE